MGLFYGVYRYVEIVLIISHTKLVIFRENLLLVD